MEGPSMTTVISSITTSLSLANLWEVVGNTVPLMAITVLFALGVGLVFKLIKKLKRHD